MIRLGMMLCCLTASAAHASGLTADEAFTEGGAFGKANIGTAKSNITTETATTGVPNYAASDAASSHFMAGQGSLTAPATSGVIDCTSTPGTADPDAHTHGKCESTRMLMNDPGKKNMMFPLDKNTDPLVVKRDAIKSDPDTYLGSLNVSGAYSGCATKTVKDPDTYLTETCNQYLMEGEESCNERLTVTIKTTESCVPGTWYGGFRLPFPIQQVDIFCDMNRADGMIRLRFTPYELHGVCSVGYLDVPKAPFTVSDKVQYGVTGHTCDTDGCRDEYGYLNYEVVTINHWKGSCTVKNFIGYEPGYIQGCSGDTCSYTFRAIDWRWGNQAVATAGFTLPKISVTETDFWDNQCAALEARLP